MMSVESEKNQDFASFGVATARECGYDHKIGYVFDVRCSLTGYLTRTKRRLMKERDFGLSVIMPGFVFLIRSVPRTFWVVFLKRIRGRTIYEMRAMRNEREETEFAGKSGVIVVFSFCFTFF